MTGFGLGEWSLDAGRLCAEVRSLNHRFLELRVRLPRFVDGAHEGTERVVVTGRVLDAATGQPVAHALARIYTVLDQGGGELLLQESGWQFTTTDGHFRLVVARGDRLRAHVARTLGAELQDTTWVSGPGSACERDLVLR